MLGTVGILVLLGVLGVDAARLTSVSRRIVGAGLSLPLLLGVPSNGGAFADVNPEAIGVRRVIPG